MTHREELLESMQNLVRESVKQILKNQVSNMDVFESRTHIQTKLQRNWPIYSRSGLFEWELTNQALISIRQCGGSWLCLGWLLVQPLSLEIYSLISGSLFEIRSKASDVTVIPDAFHFDVALKSRFVPIITMRYGGIDFDLSYAPINRYQTRLPLVFIWFILHYRILIFWMTTIFVTVMIKLFVPSMAGESQIPS